MGAEVAKPRRPRPGLLFSRQLGKEDEADILRELRQVVQTWESRQQGADRDRIWDMEFGFAEGRLWLFQIRPFVRFRNSALFQELAVMDEPMLANASRPVDLEQAPLS